MTFVNDNGFTVYVDTITGDEWIDSTVISRVPKMEYPLFHALSVGVNVWDPMMRAFGQHHGIADAWVELSLHNRYKPIFEIGLGTAKDKPSGMNFTYRSPLGVFFKIGANYNLFFNSNPDYSLFAGVRYGFAPFSFAVDDVTVNSSYWGETATFNIPSQRVTAGWFEFNLGLRVKLWGPDFCRVDIPLQADIAREQGSLRQTVVYPRLWHKNGCGRFVFDYLHDTSNHLNKPKDEDVVNIDDGIAVPTPLPQQQISSSDQ